MYIIKIILHIMQCYRLLQLKKYNKSSKYYNKSSIIPMKIRKKNLLILKNKKYTQFLFFLF